MDFCELILINSKLRLLLQEIERYFDIVLDSLCIDQIFTDADIEQVSEKKYTLFHGRLRILGRKILVGCVVEEYEPESAWISVRGIRRKDAKHFEEFVKIHFIGSR